MNINLEANKFLFELEVGQGYNDVIVRKKTKKRIYLSNGAIIHIKKLESGLFYLDSKLNNKKYPIINQVLRDIEGWLVYKKLTENYGFI
jgi:hypothetical protein